MSDNKKVICKKSLFKSTYKKNAFTKKKKYSISSEDDNFYFLIDNGLNEFSFSKKGVSPFYSFHEYFDFI